MHKKSNIIIVYLLLLWGLPLHSWDRIFAQPYLDVAPSGTENVRPFRGGAQKVPIETQVPLNELIARLEGEWDLAFSGKGYWIGYTDDMFSIANHKEAALAPLMRLLETTNSEHAKYGALFTIHLIGIERRIAGRFYEEFTSEEARNALLTLLYDESLQDHVMSLLVRDPWPSDLPDIMDAMQQCQSDCVFFVNGLFRYRLADIPFWQHLPASAEHIRVYFMADLQGAAPPLLLGIMSERKSIPSHEHVSNNIVISQATLEPNRRVWEWRYERPADEVLTLLDGRKIVSLLGDLLRIPKTLSSLVLYSLLSFFPFQYFIEGEELFLCSPQGAKQRWLDWYTEQVKHGGPAFITDEEWSGGRFR